MYICPAQVASKGPAQDVVPLTMMQDGVYVSGELLEYWCATFPRCSVHDMWNFVLSGLDDDRASFVVPLPGGSLAHLFS